MTTTSLDQAQAAGVTLLEAAEWARQNPTVLGTQVERTAIYREARGAANALGINLVLERHHERWSLELTAPDETWYPVPA